MRRATEAPATNNSAVTVVHTVRTPDGTAALSGAGLVRHR
jgi:hypothetical protein